jgi:CBS-domain-containing membrane protein
MAEQRDHEPDIVEQPLGASRRSLRQRLDWRGELLLALLPTLTVLIVMFLVGRLNRQPLLFASLASSAFLIYLDPRHNTNDVKVIASSQMMAAAIGLITYSVFGPGLLSGAISMVSTIALMVALDVVHPPAVSTALSFSFRVGKESNLVLFGLALLIVVVLSLVEEFSLFTLAWYERRETGG